MFYLLQHLIVDYNQLYMYYYGTEMILLKQYFSNLKVLQTQLKDLFKHGFLGSTSSILTQDLWAELENLPF